MLMMMRRVSGEQCLRRDLGLARCRLAIPRWPPCVTPALPCVTPVLPCVTPVLPCVTPVLPCVTPVLPCVAGYL